MTRAGRERLRRASAQHRAGDRERLAGGAVAQLEEIAEQHQPVHALQARGELLARGPAPQHVRRRAEPEVQVGDDERASSAQVRCPAGSYRVPSTV